MSQGPVEVAAAELELVAGPFSFTEGPTWDGERLLFTDMPSDRILAFSPASGRCVTALRGVGRANGLALDQSHRIVACLDEGRSVVRLEPDGSAVVLSDSFEGRRLNSPNDLQVDSHGRVWFTDPRYGDDRSDLELDHESVYRLDPRGTERSPTRVVDDTVRPNGLLLSPDERTLFVAESPRPPEGRRELRAYPVHTDGSLGPARTLVDFGPHRGIDGMCAGPDGSVVAACGWRRSGPGPRIQAWAPDGTERARVHTPSDPTNVCFGGPSEGDLYITSFDGGLWRLRDAWLRLDL